MWEETQGVKNKNGPDWALSVLHGVVSSVLSSSVVLCWIQCDWLPLDSGCDSSIGSVGSSSASVAGCVAWNVSFFEATSKDRSPKTVQEGPRLLKFWSWRTGKYRYASSVVLRDVCHYLLFGWKMCLRWCQVSIGVGASFGLLQCVSCLCLKMGEKRRRWEGGPSVAQCPETRHPLRSVRCLHGSCAGMRGWGMSGISVLHRHVEWVSCSPPPLVSQGILALCMIVVVSSLKKWILEMVVAEWRCYQHVSASPSQHKILFMFFGLETNN